jgi:hypothetical protein
MIIYILFVTYTQDYIQRTQAIGPFEKVETCLKYGKIITTELEKDNNIYNLDVRCVTKEYHKGDK